MLPPGMHVKRSECRDVVFAVARLSDGELLFDITNSINAITKVRGNRGVNNKFFIQANDRELCRNEKNTCDTCCESAVSSIKLLATITAVHD